MRDEREVIPPTEDAWHRRYWNKANRPYKGCGCLWVLFVLLVLVLIMTIFMMPYLPSYL